MARSASTTPPHLTLAPSSLTPLVLTCEHAGRALPAGVRPRPDERALLASHWGWDVGAWALTREVSRALAAGAVGGRWSRLLIDLNRRVDDETLIRREADGLTISWNRNLRPGDVEQRVLSCHAPYHERIDRLVLRRLVRGVRPLLLAVHSFTPVYEGRSRNFDVGVLFDGHGSLARRLGRALGRTGLRVRYNRPYSGMAGMMYAVDRHGKHHGLPCLELELNQGLLENHDMTPRLQRAVIDAIRELLPPPGAPGRGRGQ